MKVKELIAELQKMPQDAEISTFHEYWHDDICGWNDHCYGIDDVEYDKASKEVILSENTNCVTWKNQQ